MDAAVQGGDKHVMDYEIQPNELHKVSTIISVWQNSAAGKWNCYNSFYNIFEVKPMGDMRNSARALSAHLVWPNHVRDGGRQVRIGN